MIWGNDGNDVIRGGGGNDELIGNNGRDSIYGDAGDDLLDGQDYNGNEVDRLDGGANSPVGDRCRQVTGDIVVSCESTL